MWPNQAPDSLVAQVSQLSGHSRSAQTRILLSTQTRILLSFALLLCAASRCCGTALHADEPVTAVPLAVVPVAAVPLAVVPVAAVPPVSKLRESCGARPSGKSWCALGGSASVIDQSHPHAQSVSPSCLTSLTLMLDQSHPHAQ
jgi:hypothetical protein